MIGIAISSSWFPQAASAGAAEVDSTFFGLYFAAVLALVLVVGLAVIFVFQFRRGAEDQKGAAAGPVKLPLLGLWVLGAVALGSFAFATGFGGFLDRTVTPYGAYPIEVTARQWDWDFEYPGGHVADTLHVAVGQPVRLTLTSADVVHSLAIPAARVNAPILPDRQTEAWFEPTVADTFALHSATYSGSGFQDMQSIMISHHPADFAAWLAKASDIFAGRPLEEVGELLYSTLGCKACHSLDGSKLVGPSFKDVYGNTFDTVAGVPVMVDDAYVRESILDPNVSVIAGFEPVMTPYQGRINDKEIEAITAWLKTLSSFADTPQEGQ